MSIDVESLRILCYPDPALHAVAKPVETVDDAVRSVARRMLELMHEAEGAGLAAPQVGLPWRLFVTKATEEQPDHVYVNPQLSELDPELVVRSEGCLSLPDITLEIRRPAAATISALDLEGREFTLRNNGLLGRVWQHECDHLDGILIIDKMSPMDRIANRKLLKGMESATRM